MPTGCKLTKPAQDGVYRFPRGFNLTGPPCDGVLVIGSLRLLVALRAGPPAALLIRSVQLGVAEYSRRISATKPAGFEVRGEGVVETNEINGHSLLPASLKKRSTYLAHSLAGKAVNG